MEVKGKDDGIVSVGVVAASAQFKPQDKKKQKPSSSCLIECKQTVDLYMFVMCECVCVSHHVSTLMPVLWVDAAATQQSVSLCLCRSCCTLNFCLKFVTPWSLCTHTDTQLNSLQIPCIASMNSHFPFKNVVAELCVFTAILSN